MIERVEEQRQRRLVAALLSFLLLSSILMVAPAADASPTSLEQCFLDKINQERAAVGVAPLQFAPDIEPTAANTHKIWRVGAHSFTRTLAMSPPCCQTNGPCSARISAGSLIPI